MSVYCTAQVSTMRAYQLYGHSDTVRSFYTGPICAKIKAQCAVTYTT